MGAPHRRSHLPTTRQKCGRLLSRTSLRSDGYALVVDVVLGVIFIGIGIVLYVAVPLAMLTGAITAFRERYIPAWAVGLVTAIVVAKTGALLGELLGGFVLALALPCGVLAGYGWGLHQRRLRTGPYRPMVGATIPTGRHRSHQSP